MQGGCSKGMPEALSNTSLGSASKRLLATMSARTAEVDTNLTGLHKPQQNGFECGSRGLPSCLAGSHCERLPGASCGPSSDCGGHCTGGGRPKESGGGSETRGLASPIPRIAEANPMIIMAIFPSAIPNSDHQKQTAAILISHSLG